MSTAQPTPEARIAEIEGEPTIDTVFARKLGAFLRAMLNTSNEGGSASSTPPADFEERMERMSASLTRTENLLSAGWPLYAKVGGELQQRFLYALTSGLSQDMGAQNAVRKIIHPLIPDNLAQELATLKACCQEKGQTIDALKQQVQTLTATIDNLKARVQTLESKGTDSPADDGWGDGMGISTES